MGKDSRPHSSHLFGEIFKRIFEWDRLTNRFIIWTTVMPSFGENYLPYTFCLGWNDSAPVQRRWTVICGESTGPNSTSGDLKTLAQTCFRVPGKAQRLQR